MSVKDILDHIENVEFIILIDKDDFSTYIWDLVSEDISSILDFSPTDWRVYKDPFDCLCLCVYN